MNQNLFENLTVSDCRNTRVISQLRSSAKTLMQRQEIDDYALFEDSLILHWFEQFFLELQKIPLSIELPFQNRTLLEFFASVTEEDALQFSELLRSVRADSMRENPTKKRKQTTSEKNLRALANAGNRKLSCLQRIEQSITKKLQEELSSLPSQSHGNLDVIPFDILKMYLLGSLSKREARLLVGSSSKKSRRL